MGLIDRLFRRNRETKTTPIAETEVKHRTVVTSTPSTNPSRRKQTAKRKARKVSKSSRRKNRR